MVQKAKKRKKIFLTGASDYPLVIITIILLLVGLVMLLSASAPSSLSDTGSSYTIFSKQLGFACIGMMVCYAVGRINFRLFSNRFWRIIILGACLVLIVLVVPFGLTENGARRWVKLPGLPSFQPSEFVKVGLILYFSAYLSYVRDSFNKINKPIKKWALCMALPGAILIVCLGLIYKLQNHLSVCIIIGAITLIQIYISQKKDSYFWLTILIVSLAVGIAGFGYYQGQQKNKSKIELVDENGEVIKSVDESEYSGFRNERIKVWLDPDSNITGAGWQINQSYYAIGSGGFWGVGLNQSNQKKLYLPEAHNDFIFAVVAEELGFSKCILIMLLFALFIWRGLIIASKSTDMMGTLIAVGVTVLIGLQALINMAVVTGTLPVTGMPLPFFSYGGTSLIIDCAAVGFLIGVSRVNNMKNNN